MRVNALSTNRMNTDALWIRVPFLYQFGDSRSRIPILYITVLNVDGHKHTRRAGFHNPCGFVTDYYYNGCGSQDLRQTQADLGWGD